MDATAVTVALTPREGSGELELEARGTVPTAEDRDAGVTYG